MTRKHLPAMFFLFLGPSFFPQEHSSPADPPVMRSAYVDKLRLPGLRNGGRVNDYLYRGAQPHPAGIQELKKLGITTIVDLRGENQMQRDSERQQAESLGIRFVSIPVTGVY